MILATPVKTLSNVLETTFHKIDKCQWWGYLVNTCVCMYTYELERHVHIVSDKALVHFKHVFHRVKFVNTLK